MLRLCTGSGLDGEDGIADNFCYYEGCKRSAIFRNLSSHISTAEKLFEGRGKMAKK